VSQLKQQDMTPRRRCRVTWVE